jgi:single-strand DNA-binding protein
MNLNEVNLIGRLTRDPETRQLPSGNASVTNFTVAVNHSFSVNGERKEETAYIDCKAWNKTGELISKYCQKGREVRVTGRLQQESWEVEGNKRSKLVVLVRDISFGSSPGRDNNQQSEGRERAQSNAGSNRKRKGVETLF